MEEKETVREPYRMVLEGGQAELVEKNNMSRISLNERLSNQVYRYDRKQRRLSLATDTPDKRLDGNGTRHDRPDGKRQSR